VSLGDELVCWVVPNWDDDRLWFPKGIIVLGVGVELRLEVGIVLGEGFVLGFELGAGFWDVLNVGVVLGVVDRFGAVPSGAEVEVVWFGEKCGVLELDSVLCDDPKVEILCRVEGWGWGSF
jgi:hypothetical protein